MNRKRNTYLYQLLCGFFVLTVLFFLSLFPCLQAHAETTDKDNSTAAVQAVSIGTIDYETATIQVYPNGNTKVYYSDSSLSTWYLLEGAKQIDDANQPYYSMDISWISAKDDYELCFKGKEVTTVLSVELPAMNTAFTATYDKLDKLVTFAGDNGEQEFQWKKADGMIWNTTNMDLTDTSQAGVTEFLEQLEKMEARGGKLSFRLSQTCGNENDAGNRPSKVITIAIPKLANAPSAKITANTGKTNVTTAMEYRIYSINNTVTSTTTSPWENCSKSMLLEDMSKEAFASGTTKGKHLVIAVRKAATGKASYSKSIYLTIPGQRIAPSSSIMNSTCTAKKYTFSIDKASKTNAYQYALVKKGNAIEYSKLSWKTISSGKSITLNKSSYPEGSILYIRQAGQDKTSKLPFQLPSASATLSISYLKE